MYTLALVRYPSEFPKTQSHADLMSETASQWKRESSLLSGTAIPGKVGLDLPRLYVVYAFPILAYESRVSIHTVNVHAAF